jgi:purine-binding chemotaxis protein CheW
MHHFFFPGVALHLLLVPHSGMAQLVVWLLDAQRYALPLARVERVVRAVAVTPLPDAPSVICGVIDFHNHLIPVVNMRLRLHLPPRDVALTDLLVLAHGATRTVAFFADAVSGTLDQPDDAVAHGDGGCIAGIARLADGIILIQDLDRVLSLADEHALDLALARRNA